MVQQARDEAAVGERLERGCRELRLEPAREPLRIVRPDAKAEERPGIGEDGMGQPGRQHPSSTIR